MMKILISLLLMLSLFFIFFIFDGSIFLGLLVLLVTFLACCKAVDIFYNFYESRWINEKDN